MIKLMKLENKSVRMGEGIKFYQTKYKTREKIIGKKTDKTDWKKHGNRYKALFCFVGLENL